MLAKRLQTQIFSRAKRLALAARRPFSFFSACAHWPVPACVDLAACIGPYVGDKPTRLPDP
eukprot:440890-Pyramimonas_sp.AAC.1